jgi:hypothetical protein
MVTNRLRGQMHSASRWPNDPHERLSLALTDMEFCRVVTAMRPLAEWEVKSLDNIWNVAQKIADQAKDEIYRRNRDGKPR